MLTIIMFALSFSLDLFSLILSTQNFSVYFLKYKKIKYNCQHWEINVGTILFAYLNFVNNIFYIEGKNISVLDSIQKHVLHVAAMSL